MGKRVKILVLNPVSTDQWDQVVKELISKIASPSTHYEVRSLGRGPKSIETYYDKDVVGSQVAKEAVRAEAQGFDAMIINCFDDPGLHSSRELVNRLLVLGAGETSITTALLLGNTIGIISTGENVKGIYYRRILELGLKDRVTYIGGIQIPVLDIRRERDYVKKLLKEEITKALNANSEVIVLGCTGFAGVAEEVSEEMNVPVLDPLAVTFKVAEALSGLGLTHSKVLSYMPPAHKVDEMREMLSQL